MARILIVDDEPHVQELIDVILRGEGHETTIAADGHEALQAIERSIPDLIVLDLQMPGMDGWHFLDELYRRGLRKRTRVVIVSGYLEEDSDERSGVRHLLAKPFDAQTLVALVSDALERDPVLLAEERGRTDSLARLMERLDQVWDR